MNVRSLPLVLLGLGLLAPASAARADLVAPGYVETCTLAQQRRAGEECIECGASFQDATACTVQFLQAGYTARCRTSGASVWQEIGCRPAGAAPTPVVSPTPVTPPPTPAPGVPPSTNEPSAQPIPAQPPAVPPAPANEAPAAEPTRGMCSARPGHGTGTAALALLALGLALGLARRRS